MLTRLCGLTNMPHASIRQLDKGIRIARFRGVSVRNLKNDSSYLTSILVSMERATVDQPSQRTFGCAVVKTWAGSVRQARTFVLQGLVAERTALAIYRSQRPKLSACVKFDDAGHTEPKQFEATNHTFRQETLVGHDQS